MLIKKLRWNVFDCWEGDGWDQWVRLQKVDKQSWKVVAGDPQFSFKAARILDKKLGGPNHA